MQNQRTVAGTIGFVPATVRWLFFRAGVGSHTRFPLDTFDIFLRLHPGEHDLPSAAQASELKIHARPKHLPVLRAAGVLFFHMEHIVYTNIQENLLLFPVTPPPSAHILEDETERMMTLHSPFRPEGRLLATRENRERCVSPERLRLAQAQESILEGTAIFCDAAHTLTVRLGPYTGFIPREEGALGIAEGRTRDVALLSRVGQPVAFVVTAMRDDGTLLLSRRRAQELALAALMEQLHPGDILPATVTHLEPFGAFVDIGCGLPSLLGLESLSVSRIRHPDRRFSLGQEIFAVVTGLDRQLGRVYLSHKELLGTWLENAEGFPPGVTAPGIVRGVQEYGVFVELTANLSGLAETALPLQEDDRVAVCVKSALPSRMKLKLSVVGQLPPAPGPAPLCYYRTEGHIDRWEYAPPGCGRVGAVSVFTDPS